MHRDTHHSPLSTQTVFFLTIAVCAVALLPTILWDFAYDQGTFAYGGAAILRGERPYLDFWDIKPPNIFYTYAAAFGFLGNTIRAIRLLDFFNTLVSVILLFDLSVRLWTGTTWGRLAAVMASAAFVLQYY